MGVHKKFITIWFVDVTNRTTATVDDIGAEGTSVTDSTGGISDNATSSAAIAEGGKLPGMAGISSAPTGTMIADGKFTIKSPSEWLFSKSGSDLPST
jgi:hypothetical protein